MSLTQPKTYGRWPYRRPQGSLDAATREAFDGIDKNFDLIQSSFQSLIGYAKQLEQIIPEDTVGRVYALEQGRVRVVTDDPGDPVVGAGMAFILSDPGVSASYIVRFNDNGTILQAVTALT